MQDGFLVALAFVLALASGCASLSTDDSEHTVIFTGLTPNESVKAKLVLDGEWGDSAYEFVFHGGSKHLVSVVKLTGEWSAKTKTFSAHRRTAPVEVNLSGDDLWGLNQLLAYYRAGPPETCNDIEIITLERVRGDKTIASERFVDKSCNSKTAQGVTTLWDVIHRVDFPK
jgi:hypothetical protein